MTTRTYEAVTSIHYVKIVAEADKELGMALSGNSGKASADNVTISWNYDPTAQVLVLQCLKKPWYVLESMVDSKLDALVNSTQ